MGVASITEFTPLAFIPLIVKFI